MTWLEQDTKTPSACSLCWKLLWMNATVTAEFTSCSFSLRNRRNAFAYSHEDGSILNNKRIRLTNGGGVGKLAVKVLLVVFHCICVITFKCTWSRGGSCRVCKEGWRCRRKTIQYLIKVDCFALEKWNANCASFSLHCVSKFQTVPISHDRTFHRVGELVKDGVQRHMMHIKTATPAVLYETPQPSCVLTWVDSLGYASVLFTRVNASQLSRNTSIRSHSLCRLGASTTRPPCVAFPGMGQTGSYTFCNVT